MEIEDFMHKLGFLRYGLHNAALLRGSARKLHGIQCGFTTFYGS